MGLRLSKYFDEAALSRSLLQACYKFPSTMGRLAVVNGQHFVQTPAHDVGVRRVLVTTEGLSCRVMWQQVLDMFPLRVNNIPGERLLQVLESPVLPGPISLCLPGT